MIKLLIVLTLQLQFLFIYDYGHFSYCNNTQNYIDFRHCENSLYHSMINEQTWLHNNLPLEIGGQLWILQ